MSSFFKSILILMLVSQSVFAQTDDLKSLLNQFHEEIEHSQVPDETKSQLQKTLLEWVHNFNLVRISIDTHRWTQMKYHQDAGKSKYVKNFPVLASFYFLSHSIEMFSGPLGVYLASDMGLSSSTQVLIGTVGAIISVPGLDPLCLLLFAVSPLNPVQKVMSGIRIVAVKVSGRVSSQLRLKQIAEKFFESEDRLSAIVKYENTQMSLIYDSEKNILRKELVLKSEDKTYIKLIFRSKEKRTWLESLEILDDEVLRIHANDLNLILKQMNLSVRSAIQNILKNPRRTFYVENISVEDGKTKIQIKDFAIMLKPRLKLKSQSSPVVCESLFRGF